LKWRLEAIRTKRSFAEVVLLHTLVYRVEEIFLIHTQSGILLQHVGAEANHGKDPDLVSGMLTAIQEFVKDSFNSQTGEMLDTLRMDGDHSVWIEQGPHAMLAAVIRLKETKASCGTTAITWKCEFVNGPGNWSR